MFGKKIGNIPKAIGSLMTGCFLVALTVSYAQHGNWLIAAILGIISFCGYVAAYHYLDLEAKEELKHILPV